MFLSVFAKTFAALAVAALGVAQTLKWDTPEDVRTSSFVLGFSLLMAVIGAVIAALWAVVSEPAVTPLGRAVRSAIEALLASPLAVVAANALGWEDFANVGSLVVPTVIGMVLAFALSFAANYAPAPVATKALGADVAGTSPSPA